MRKIKIITSEVDEGNLAYWPEGQCFSIFFGKAPIFLRSWSFFKELSSLMPP